MPHELLFVRLPEIASKETFVVQILNHPAIPEGIYSFPEMYCNEPDCDCRRALIQVWDNRKPGHSLALIGYGWEPPAFYRKWFHGEEGWEELVGAELAVGTSQGRHAEDFLAIFRQLLTHPDNAERIRRHYAQFRAAPAARNWSARSRRK